MRPGQVLAPPSVSRGVLAPRRCVVAPALRAGRTNGNVGAGRAAIRGRAGLVGDVTVGTLACRCTPLFRRREIRVTFGHRPRYEPTTGNPQRRTRPVRGSSRRVGLCSGLCVCAQTLWGHGTMHYGALPPCASAGYRYRSGLFRTRTNDRMRFGCWPWPFLSQMAPMHAISDRLHSLLDRTLRASPDPRAPRRLGR